MRLSWFRPVRAQAVDDLEEKRSGRGSSDKFAIGLAIEIADPNAKHVMIKNRNRPRIVKTVGRSRFPKYRIGMAGIGAIHFRARHVSEHIQNQE